MTVFLNAFAGEAPTPRTDLDGVLEAFPPTAINCLAATAARAGVMAEGVKGTLKANSGATEDGVECKGTLDDCGVPKLFVWVVCP